MIKHREKQHRACMLNDTNDVKNFQRILVHCSAGIGRTGTLISAYCIVESLYHMYKTL